MGRWGTAGGAALVALALTAPVVAAKPAPAWEATVSRVSGPSPFPETGCDELDHEVYSAVGTLTGLGTPVPEREMDVSIAANPTDPGNLVAAWVQDEASGIVAASSFDGGATWQRTGVAGLTSCTDDDVDADRRILHARLAAGPDGRFYLAGEALNGYFPDPRSGQSRIPVVTSTDGGRSWSEPVYVDDLPLMNGFDTIAADPSEPGRVYVAWHTPEPLAAAYLSWSTGDGGPWTAGRWERVEVPRYAADSLPFNRVVAAPDGTVHVVGVDATVRTVATATAAAGDLAMRGPLTAVRLDPDTRTWSERVVIDDDVPVEWVSAGVGSDGTLYVASWDEQPGELALWRSADAGDTWEGPLPIATTGTPFPVLAVGPDGTLGVTVKSFTDDGRERVTFLASRDGGHSWTATPVTGALDRPVDPGFYQETVAAGPRFASVYVATGPGATVGPVDTFVAVLSPGPRRGPRR